MRAGCDRIMNPNIRPPRTSLSVLAIASLIACAHGAEREAERPAKEAKACWSAGRTDRSTPVQMTLRSPIRWEAGEKKWEIVLEVSNTSNDLLWVNKRGAHGQHGLPGEFEISLRVESRRGQVRKGKVYTQGDQPSMDDYAVLRPNEMLVIEESIDASEFDMDPGEYAVSVCFWDQALSIPPPPEGLIPYQGPFVTGPAALIRR